jgi:hypothetical protein
VTTESSNNFLGFPMICVPGLNGLMLVSQMDDLIQVVLLGAPKRIVISRCDLSDFLQRGITAFELSDGGDCYRLARILPREAIADKDLYRVTPNFHLLTLQ